MTHRTGSRPFHCALCGLPFPSSALHVSYSRPRSLACTACEGTEEPDGSLRLSTRRTRSMERYDLIRRTSRPEALRVVSERGLVFITLLTR